MIESHAPFDDRVKINQPIARYTAARLGGVADYLYVADDPEFLDTIEVLQTAWKHNIPVTFIGGGANVLVSDKGIRGLTVVNRITQLDHGEWENGTTVSATSGTSLIRLARYCQEHGYSGMEWAIGVPGTVGGAVVNNAGAHNAEMADSVHEVVIYEPEHGARLYHVDELDYDYRYSALKVREGRRFMVFLATFKLTEDNPRAIRLIEMAGLKGYRIGGAQVSPVHANFFVNLGDDTTATDYIDLIHHVQQIVHKKFNVDLELEIQIIGEWN